MRCMQNEAGLRMRVKDLIRILKKFDPEMDIVQSDIDAYHYHICDFKPKIVYKAPKFKHNIVDPEIVYPALELSE